ncbi:MAG: helix-turn-helix domain-containing protein, partial [Longimicrobiales bacterium]
MTDDPLDQDPLDPIFRALANAWRRRILDLLRRAPRTTGELSEALPDISRFAVMQHLKVLEEARLVVHVRDGRQRINHLNPVPI